jgi:hypothetical protein
MRRRYSMTVPDRVLSISGKSIALRLANDGYDVCINDISANKQGAEEVAHEITQLGRKATVAIGDVSVMSEVESVVQQSVNELGPLNTMFVAPTLTPTKPPNPKKTNPIPPTGSPTPASPKSKPSWTSLPKTSSVCSASTSSACTTATRQPPNSSSSKALARSNRQENF